MTEGVTWIKSSRSAQSGNCVEVTRWRKAQHSQQSGECVEVAAVEMGQRVR